MAKTHLPPGKVQMVVKGKFFQRNEDSRKLVKCKVGSVVTVDADTAASLKDVLVHPAVVAAEAEAAAAQAQAAADAAKALADSASEAADEGSEAA
jgi:regulator of protease activity HflC (stomatin/prohibitin superfamily)